jgi:hypothetical protein
MIFFCVMKRSKKQSADLKNHNVHTAFPYAAYNSFTLTNVYSFFFSLCSIVWVFFLNTLWRSTSFYQVIEIRNVFFSVRLRPFKCVTTFISLGWRFSNVKCWKTILESDYWVCNYGLFSGEIMRYRKRIDIGKGGVGTLSVQKLCTKSPSWL